MKKNLITSLKLSVICIVLLSIVYPLLISGIGKMAPVEGNGEKLEVNGKVVGYANIGQQFTSDKYFQGRPSSVTYNAAGSGGSNKGPSNPAYLVVVQQRIDTLQVHNPGITKAQIPADMVTASASGLDPDISPDAAYLQVKRIALVRKITEEKLNDLVASHIQKPFLGLFGPSKVNVLTLNIALDALQ